MHMGDNLVLGVAPAIADEVVELVWRSRFFSGKCDIFAIEEWAGTLLLEASNARATKRR